MQRLVLMSVVGLLGALAFTPPAHAYLDAGTGSMIVQLLIAGVAGALVMIKVYWFRLKRLFRRGSEPKDENVGELES